jgi:hypothetical protein
MMVMLSPCPSRPDLAGGVPWPSAVRSWLAAMLLAGIVFGQLGGHEMGLEETDRSRSKKGGLRQNHTLLKEGLRFDRPAVFFSFH